jgi:hypothetical protein
MYENADTNECIGFLSKRGNWYCITPAIAVPGDDGNYRVDSDRSKKYYKTTDTSLFKEAFEEALGLKGVVVCVTQENDTRQIKSIEVVSGLEPRPVLSGSEVKRIVENHEDSLKRQVEKNSGAGYTHAMVRGASLESPPPPLSQGGVSLVTGAGPSQAVYSASPMRQEPFSPFAWVPGDTPKLVEEEEGNITFDVPHDEELGCSSDPQLSRVRG